MGKDKFDTVGIVVLVLIALVIALGPFILTACSTPVPSTEYVLGTRTPGPGPTEYPSSQGKSPCEWTAGVVCVAHYVGHGWDCLIISTGVNVDTRCTRIGNGNE